MRSSKSLIRDAPEIRSMDDIDESRIIVLLAKVEGEKQ